MREEGISKRSEGICMAYISAAYIFVGKNADATAKHEKAIELARQNQVITINFLLHLLTVL